MDTKIFQNVKDENLDEDLIETKKNILVGLQQLKNGEGEDVDTVFERLHKEVATD